MEDDEAAPEQRERFAEVLRGIFLDEAAELGPATRAYLAQKVEDAHRDGATTFDAQGLQEALVEDSPEVVRIDRGRPLS